MCSHGLSVHGISFITELPPEQPAHRIDGLKEDHLAVVRIANFHSLYISIDRWDDALQLQFYLFLVVVVELAGTDDERRILNMLLLRLLPHNQI